MADSIISTPTKYQLPEEDRQEILAGIPKINYENGIIPNFLLKECWRNFPQLACKTQITVDELEQIMQAEVSRQ